MASNINIVKTFLHDLLFFSGDVQTTTIALAITVSLLLSIIWLLVNLYTGHTWPPGGSTNAGRSRRRLGSSARAYSSVVSFHLGKRGLSVKSSAGAAYGRRSVWTCRRVEKNCAVPCIGCGIISADKLCRYILCLTCCLGNRATMCNYHSSIKHTIDTAKQGQVNCSQGERPIKMDLSHQQLSKCPARVGFLGCQLSVLNLSNNQLQELPYEIGCLRGLRNLHLQYNHINKLPDSLGSLRWLEDLNLCCNHLSYLPCSLGLLEHLVVLQVASNCLEELPATLGNLRQLVQLHVHCNKLTELPESLCNLTKLELLYVGENPLVQLPNMLDRFVRLEVLDASLCYLETVPSALTRCSALCQLNLAHNRLCALPSQFGRLHRLKELHLRDNQLHYLPAAIVALDLYTLSVDDNPLLEESDIYNNQKMAPCVSPKTLLPPLLELVGRYIIDQAVIWKGQNLPKHLEELLRHVRYCSCCDGPFLSFFKSRLDFVQLGGLSRVPVYQHICSPHLPMQCSLRQISQQT